MNILVTGGAGFIGSHTVDLLLKKGHEVRILDNLTPPAHPDGKIPGYVPEDASFLIGDVRNKNDMKRALQHIDIVFHLAAYQGYLTDFGTFALVNDFGTALLYETIVNERLPVQKVILGSSQSVYGEGRYECSEHGTQYPPPRSLAQLERSEWEVKCQFCHQYMRPLLTDEQRVNPHNQYAISKYCQELYALNLGRRFGIPTVVLRFSITQGPRQSFYNAYSGILRIFATRMFSNLPPVIYEDGQQLRDYVYVGDVARANLMVMENQKANFEVFNVGANKAMTVFEYAEIFSKYTGRNIEPEIRGKFRFGDTRHIISDISKLGDLGWQPQTPAEKIVAEYVDWVETQPGRGDYYAEAERVMREQGVIRLRR